MNKLWQKIWYYRNNFSDLIYPGGPEAYQAMQNICFQKYGSPNCIQCWKNVLWRQIGHLVSAILILALQVGAFFLLSRFSYNLALSFYVFTCLLVTAFLTWNEGYSDPKNDGAFFFKNVIDWSVQVIPCWLVLILLLRAVQNDISL